MSRQSVRFPIRSIPFPIPLRLCLLILLLLSGLGSCSDPVVIAVKVGNIPARAAALAVRVSSGDRLAPEFPLYNLRPYWTGEPFAFSFGVEPKGAAGTLSIGVAVYDLTGCLIDSGSGDLEPVPGAPSLSIALDGATASYARACAVAGPSSLALARFQQQEDDPTQFMISGWGFAPGVTVEVDGVVLASATRRGFTRITGPLQLTPAPSGLRQALLKVQNPDGAWTSLPITIHTLTFAPRTRSTYVFPASYEPQSVRAIDLDKDGKLDLVVGGRVQGMTSSGFVAFFRNPGDGALAGEPVISLLSRASTVDAMEFMPLSAGAQLDLVAVDPGRLQLLYLKNTGGGRFSAELGSIYQFPTWLQPSSVALGAFSGVSLPDILVMLDGSPAESYIGSFQMMRAGLQLQYAIPLPATVVSQMLVRDLNRDGTPDISYGLYDFLSTFGAPPSGHVRNLLYRGAGSGVFDNPPVLNTQGNLLTGLISLDPDGDGYPDLLTTGRATSSHTANSLVWLFQNPGSASPGQFPSIGSPIPVGSSPARLVAGDFNHDGRDDFAVALTDVTNSVQFVLNRGSPGGWFPSTPESLPTFALGSGAIDLAAGDFDGDTWADLAVISAGSATLQQPGMLQVFRNSSPR